MFVTGIRGLGCSGSEKVRQANGVNRYAGYGVSATILEKCRSSAGEAAFGDLGPFCEASRSGLPVALLLRRRRAAVEITRHADGAGALRLLGSLLLLLHLHLHGALLSGGLGGLNSFAFR